jgi:hypothetical protein
LFKKITAETGGASSFLETDYWLSETTEYVVPSFLTFNVPSTGDTKLP